MSQDTMRTPATLGALACAGCSAAVIMVGQEWPIFALIMGAGLPWGILVAITQRTLNGKVIVGTIAVSGIAAFLIGAGIQSLIALAK